jgi:hypothetical protein
VLHVDVLFYGHGWGKGYSLKAANRGSPLGTSDVEQTSPEKHCHN